jgi:hypothetical protein
VRHLRGVAVPVAVVVCFVALFGGVLRLVEPPAIVDGVTLENGTGFDVEIGVTDGSRASELPLAPVDARATTRVEDVLDQGSDWVFRITRAGEAIGTLERNRDRLRADGWRLVVPVAWDDRIATAEPTSAIPR